MLKRLLLISAYLLLLNRVYAQHTAKELSGRWRTQLANGRADDLLFIGGGKGAVISPDNRLCAYFNYRTTIESKSINMGISFDVEREKHPNWDDRVSITFLTDSTFLFKATGFVSSYSNYFTKKDRIYTRVKTDTQEKDLRVASNRDLKGRWIGDRHNFDDPDTKDKKDMQMFFVDEDHLVEMYGDSARTATYRIDFTKQPSPVEVIFTASGRTVPAFLMFIGTDKMRLQWFPYNNRGDHFTAIGKTLWLLKLSPADLK